MKVVTEKRTKIIENEVTVNKFNVIKDGSGVSLDVENGEIVEVFFYDPKKGRWGTRKTDYNHNNIFDQLSQAAITFIANNEPNELNFLIDVLSPGSMQDFCKILQKNTKVA